MNKILFVFLLTIPLFVFANEETLETVLQRHTQAIGGQAAIEATKSIRISLQIQEPEFTVDGVYVADRHGRMRIDIYAGGKRVYTEASDGTSAWEMGGDGKVKVSSEKGRKALQRGAMLPGKLYGLHEMNSQGHTLEMVARETVDSVNYYVLKLTLKDGHSLKYYIHPETWFVERSRDSRALHVDVNPKETTIENRLQDYRKVDGIMRSFLSEEFDLEANKKLSTNTIKKIERNVTLEDSLFKKPELVPQS